MNAVEYKVYPTSIEAEANNSIQCKNQIHLNVPQKRTFVQYISKCCQLASTTYLTEEGKVERHCPLQTGKRAQNRFTDNPEHPRRLPSSYLPPSLLPFTPNVAVHTPTPRIREVETTSRHFVCADRPSETGGDNRETERLWQPTATAPGTVAAGTSGEILSVLLREGKHHRKDKTSEDGKPESVIYMCA